MKTKEIAINLKNELLNQFEQHFDVFASANSDFVKDRRRKAAKIFKEIGFPSRNLESWRKTDLTKVLSKDYALNLSSKLEKNNIHDFFSCEINQFDTDLYTQVNGWCVEKQESPKVYENGCIVGSIKAAMHQYPELFEKHYGKYVTNEKNGLIALNSAIFSDGYFIYIPDGVDQDRTLQMVNIINSKKHEFVNARNLVILGKNARLKLVHCDDSIEFKNSLINSVTEVFIDSGAKLDYYKLQNKDEEAVILTNTFFHQEADSSLMSNTLILNGGLVRNDINVLLNGRGANADVVGLYLVDGKQFVDNHIYIDHAVSNCTSNTTFKGIADDEARSVFNGHVLVRQDAQQTLAFQNNHNIQLTNTSKIDTHPFLEIYADDVKCSHGATVGQLDKEALFYIMQRGICERNAKMLLMLAFVGEIVNKISLPTVQEYSHDLVTRRLKGELSACDQCSIECADPDKPLVFEIDMSKV
ncbi:MAG: Fe-S cluster assembly protein SufD [Bacteroidales bacterium]|nr:Fe-S cluster assembly protein SufD [Bacteroidales bacterium]